MGKRGLILGRGGISIKAGSAGVSIGQERGNKKVAIPTRGSGEN